MTKPLEYGEVQATAIANYIELYACAMLYSDLVEKFNSMPLKNEFKKERGYYAEKLRITLEEINKSVPNNVRYKITLNGLNLSGLETLATNALRESRF